MCQSQSPDSSHPTSRFPLGVHTFVLYLYVSISALQIRSSRLPWWHRWLRICLQCRRLQFDPWVGKIPWKRAWQPISVSLPGESSWTEEPGGLQSMGSQRVGHDWVTKHSTYYFSRFHVWVNIQYLFFSFWFHSVWPFLGPFMSLQITQFHSFYDTVIFHCIYAPHLLYPFLCWWSFRCFHVLAIVNSDVQPLLKLRKSQSLIRHNQQWTESQHIDKDIVIYHSSRGKHSFAL